MAKASGNPANPDGVNGRTCTQPTAGTLSIKLVWDLIVSSKAQSMEFYHEDFTIIFISITFLKNIPTM